MPNEYAGPTCAICWIKACDVAPEEAQPPQFCPLENEPELLAKVEKSWLADPRLQELAAASARTEVSGYMRRTRIEDIMDFAQRIGAHRLGIAHCIGLMAEAKLALQIFQAHGFEVFTSCCKVGSIPKERVGLLDSEKLEPGTFEPVCNPIAQAALLASAGTQLNVVIGLCVGHDSLFFMHTKAPATVLVAKDRVLGHNPVAALYLSRSYYRRLTEGVSADDFLRRRMGVADGE